MEVVVKKRKKGFKNIFNSVSKVKIDGLSLTVILAVFF